MIPSTYVQRALATVRRNPRAALFSYAGTVWAIGEQRRIERERFATREARQRRVDELRRLCAG
jgi:ribosomal protein S9